MNSGIPIINNPFQVTSCEIEQLRKLGICYVKKPVLTEYDVQKSLDTIHQTSRNFFRQASAQKQQFPTDMSKVEFFADRRTGGEQQDLQHVVFRPDEPLGKFKDDAGEEITRLGKTFQNYVAQPLLMAIIDQVFPEPTETKTQIQQSIKSCTSTIHLPYYNPQDPESVAVPMGLERHRDLGWITILDVTSEGLQVWRDGYWQSVMPPSPEYLVVNLGDILALVTGQTRAPLHQVVRPRQERTTVSYFYEANHLEPVINYKGERLYETGAEYIQDILSKHHDKNTFKRFFAQQNIRLDQLLILLLSAQSLMHQQGAISFTAFLLMKSLTKYFSAQRLDMLTANAMQYPEYPVYATEEQQACFQDGASGKGWLHWLKSFLFAKNYGNNASFWNAGYAQQLYDEHKKHQDQQEPSEVVAKI